MEIKAADLAKTLGGSLHGDGQLIVRGAAGLSEATASDLSYLKDAGKKEAAVKSGAGAVLVPKGVMLGSKTTIEVENPQAAYVSFLVKLDAERPKPAPGIHPQSFISASASIGKNVSIGPFAVVEDGAVIEDGVTLMAQVYVGRNATVGAGSLLYPQVILREDVKIGRRCILHAGAVIGSDGYGFYFGGGQHNKIPQIGTVIVEDDVEIGSCTCIDRATTGATVIGRGTKIDNMVQVAHNVRVGALSLLAAQVGIAGSTRLEEGVVMGGQAGVADHLIIGAGAQIGGKTGVMADVKPKAVLFGTPAQPLQDALRQFIFIRRLPELFQFFRKMKGNAKND